VTDATDQGPVPLHNGPLHAEIDPQGATLVDLTAFGRSVVVGPGRVEPSLGHHGAVLAPWPNRIDRGRYSFDGKTHQLPINDPGYGHAIHGFAFGRNWRVEYQTADAVELSLAIGPEPGYPFEVRLSIDYRLLDDRMLCTVRWQNPGATRAPFGIGFHPYFSPGPSPMEEWLLEVPALSYFDVDSETALPTTIEPVINSDYDFRQARAIGPARFSRAFGALERTGGPASIRVIDPNCVTLEIGMSEEFKWIQVFTADLPDPSLRRKGIAIEPQTCPPNSFVNGVDVRCLEAGETGEAQWWVSVTEPKGR